MTDTMVETRERDAELRDARIAAALADLRRGRPVLVADDADRENEVDVVLAAGLASVEWMGWAVRHSSGLLCVPMSAERAERLGLPLMVEHNQDPRRTSYTVTVDAARGVSTGISAADRARTARVLADPGARASDLIRPGHVLPLRAAAGGVLERGGHTEAAVDLCRLAGLEPVGVISELVLDDGSMARHADALALADEAGLVVLTIAELAAWRRAHGDAPAAAGDAQAGLAEASHEAHDDGHDRVLHTGAARLPTVHGVFTVHGYRDLVTGAEHAAMVALPGTVPGADVPLVRVHSECLTGDAFGSLRCDCGPQLDAALQQVAREGGAVVYLGGHEGRGIGLLAKIDAYALQDAGRDTVQANLDLGLPVDRREYGAAAAILHHLGLERVRLLTNNPDKEAALREHGVEVAQTVPLEVGLTPENRGYLRTKALQMGHRLPMVLAESDQDHQTERTGA